MMSEETPFTPDWVSPPGETIADLLTTRRLSTSQLAAALGQTLRDVEQLLAGRLKITHELSSKLHSVLGLSPAFWINRESKYRVNLVRLNRNAQDRDQSWVRELPLKDMMRFGWIDLRLTSIDPLKACLQFFDVPDIPTWKNRYEEIICAAAFRTSPSFASDKGAVAAWLRYGEVKGLSVECDRWDATRFRDVISDIRPLTRIKDPQIFLPKLKKLCASCGVALVIARAPSGCRASGATRFFSEAKALILLSFRYLSDDQFWFSFFHEAGHLILHQHQLFLEGTGVVQTLEEREASAFAAEVLIPKKFDGAFCRLRPDALEIIRFARQVGVSPGIIVGQLQNRKRILHSQLNRLKRRFVWQ